jgi:creatinine amidohydrolase
MDVLPTKFWAEMTWRDFAAADMSKAVAVLPVAAIEQHGPHLPVGVDAFINEGYLARAVERVPPDLPVLFLPLQAIGKSNEHIDYPGTLTFSMETVTRAWTEIGDSVARTGCRKLIFMNSHGGNVAALAAIVRELRVRHGMLAVHAGWHTLGYPEGLFSAEERAHGIHGGDAETSLMLAFRPQTVRMSEARNFVSSAVSIERDFKRLRVTQPIAIGWMANDLNELGAAGDASNANAAKGEACADSGVEGFIELLRDVYAFDLARLGHGPLAGGQAAQAGTSPQGSSGS